MKVNLTEFEQHMAYRRLINETPLEDIEIYKDGKKIEVDPKLVEDFKYYGLNNTDFIINFGIEGQQK